MSYQTLYRKYRPSDLDDVSGQSAIVKIIKNSLKLNRISHAYLFCGPRGTGKTTMARILAKNINCLNLQDGIACGKCKNCISILNGNCPDIIELDAASNNGVDEIREIKNKVSLVPTELKYKVYVIDEVHMLSSGAFNALLKTLEEPPEHVIFILATTDVHKVPVTIISRCQCLDFHRVREDDIIHRLRYICESENIKIDDEILKSIANLSDGGFRDAIGMLDKLVSYSDQKITLDDFEELNGIVSIEKKKEFLSLVENGEINKIIEFIDFIYNCGKDLVIFSQDLMVLCRNMIINYYSYENTDCDIEFLLSFVEKMDEIAIALKESNNLRIIFETKILSFIYQRNKKSYNTTLKNVSSESENNTDSEQIKYDTNVQDTMKMTDDNIDVDSHMTSQKKEKSFDSNSESAESQIDTHADTNFSERNSIIINNCFYSASKDKLLHIKNSWNLLNDYALDNKYGAAACYLSDATIRASGSHEIIITFDYESVVSRGFQFNTQIEQLLFKIFGEEYHVAYLTNEEWEIEKNKYIENKNNGINYQYLDLNSSFKQKESVNKNLNEDNTALPDNSIVDDAIKLFGENMVSVNE